jgi:4-hydroxybenzoate polyprenyltransferase
MSVLREEFTPSRWRVVRAYLVLPHTVPIVVVLAATAIFALIAVDGWPGIWTMIRLLGAMLGGQLIVGVVNELVDANLDTVAKSDKPLATGLVTRRGAYSELVLGALLLTGFGLSFALPSFAICLLGTGAGVAYSLWFKRTIWSWVPYLAALPLLPIWVWSALRSVDTGLFGIYPIGAAAMIAVQIAQSLPDVEADHAAGVRTLAVALGSRRAFIVCHGSLLGAIILAAGLAPLLTDRPAFVWIAATISTCLIALNWIIWTRNARRGALACFPCISVGTAILGLGWAAAIALG